MIKIKLTKRILPATVLAIIFLITATISISYWNNNSGEGAFIGSLLPEIIGLLLEGVAFVFALSVIQEARDAFDKDQLRLSLEKHASLIIESFKTGNPWGWDKHAINAKPMKEFEEYGRKIYYEINQKNFPLSPLQIKALLEMSDQVYDTLLGLIPVAANISPEQLMEWTSLISNVRNLKGQYKAATRSEGPPNWPSKDSIAMQLQELVQSSLFTSNLKKCDPKP